MSSSRENPKLAARDQDFEKAEEFSSIGRAPQVKQDRVT
jgi:hypothetical protein